MIAFVDAAVAIALTLLILPLAELVPEAATEDVPAAEIVTGNLAPIGSFLLSFAVIARFWVGHHRLFAWVEEATPALVSWNLLWVLTIVVLPFPTEMVGTYGDDPFVVRFYVLVLLACSACLTAMTVLVDRSATPGEGPPPGYVRGSLVATGLLAVAFVLVLVVPGVGYWALVVLVLSGAADRVSARMSGRHTTAD